jgi:Lysyl oxidase/S-layer homology domain
VSRRLRARGLRAGFAAILVIGMLLPSSGSQSTVSAGSEALPDLAMAPLGDFRIQWVNGRKLLRFTAMMVNGGAGHFEVRGRRNSTSEPMVVRQVIFENSSHSSPISRFIKTDAVAKYSGDGHNHWHVQEMMRYDLWDADRRRRGAKVGFCFLDSDTWNTQTPGFGPSYYRGAWCSTDPNARSNRMGISIGWGDEYEWFLAYQWVDITGLPDGTYTLRGMVDPNGHFLEARETNQCAYARLGISGNTVSLQIRERRCANDWIGTPFEDDIRWMFQNDITTGCLPGGLYCPNDPVDRVQLATFLARAFDLPPPSGVDFFTDDNHLRHEGAINRVAEAGIMSGCQPNLFCPTRLVSRAQLASYLSHALGLPRATGDYFTDDNNSPYEGAINKIAEAGITTGCAPDRYCPEGKVTRGMLAAFLHRAIGG